MRRGLLLSIAILLLSPACTRGVSEVHTLPLPAPNPTSYVFPLHLDELRTAALEQLGIPHQVRSPIFSGTRAPGELMFSGSLAVATSDEPALAADVFADPANAHDIVLVPLGGAVWRTPVYRGRKQALPYTASFHLHLSAVDGATTRISVTALQPRIINGEQFGVGSCGPGYAYRFEPVAPTTVEEYMILRYIGAGLNLKMPPVSMPSSEPRSRA